MDQLKSLTLPSWGRLAIYLALLGAGIALAALAKLGFGTYTEMPGGGWSYTFTVTSFQLNAFLSLIIGGGGTAATALILGTKSRVGDIPVAERLGERDLSSPPIPKSSPVVQ